MVVALIDFIQLIGSHSGENMAGKAFETLTVLEMVEKVHWMYLYPLNLRY